MKKISKWVLTQSEFVRNTMIIGIGTSIAQLFPMLFYPILSRLFSPAEFGLLATLTAITGILAVLASGKYESAILIADSKEEAANLIGLTLALSFFFLIVSIIVLQLGYRHLENWLNEPGLAYWLFICPISAFAIIIFNCYNEWCVRNKYFSTLAVNKVTNASSTTLSKLFLGLIKISGNGLALGDLLGRLVSAGICLYRAIKIDKETFTKISILKFKPLAIKFKEFPKYTLPDQLLSQIGGTLPILFIGTFYNSTEVGYYGMTMNILSVPVSVVSIAIRDVFRQKANEDYLKTGSCKSLFVKLLKNISILGILGSIGLFFILPTLFSFVLGKEWQISGEYSRILLPMITLSFISMSLSGVLIIRKKMNISMFWQIYYVLSTLLSLIIGFLVFNNLKMVLICFAIGRSSAYLMYILLSFHFSKAQI